MRAILLLAVLASTGCLRKTEFQCTDDGACGAGGRCEPTNFCSFADPDCTSGRRYDQSAGTLAGQCTGGGNPTDAPLVDTPVTGGDAPMGDAPPAGCPTGYVMLTGGQGNHLYKVLAVAENWTVQESLCAQTSSSSHLAAPEDITELTAIDGAVAVAAHWVGVTDSAMEGTWRNTLGAIQTYLPWIPPAPDNNAGGQGEDCVEGITATHGFNDRRCNDKLPAVCECVPP